MNSDVPPGGWAEPDGPAARSAPPPPAPGPYQPYPAAAPPRAPRARNRYAKLIVAVCAVLVVTLLAVEITLEVREALRQVHKAVRVEDP